MKTHSVLSFPYEFTELNAEEKILLNKVYESYPIDFVRVGPKGYIVHEPYKRHAANIYNLPLCDGDIFVTSYQRSGTTWVQELVWLLANDLDYDTAKKLRLTERYAFLEYFMYFEEGSNDALVKWITDREKGIDPHIITNMIEEMSKPASRMLANVPSPGFIKTHLPMSLLPPSILDTAKMIYVARDPRDVAVSSYHQGKFFKMAGLTGEFKDLWNTFHTSIFTLTPFFEHVKEAWDKRNHPNMVFLFYEELLKDFPAVIRRIADFLGKDVTEQQIEHLQDHLNIDNFRSNQSVNYEEMRDLGMLNPGETFIRQGKSGGWRDYFDKEMTEQAERWIAENLRDTDLRFPSFSH